MDDVISRQAAINAMGRAEWAINRINELPSAQPEKTHLSEEDATSDCISRQDAIDALKEAFNPSITNFVKAKLAIENLPSAQPNAPDTNVGDTISRQDAIDTVKRLLGDCEITRTLQTALHIMPSAKPEPCEDTMQ